MFIYWDFMRLVNKAEDWLAIKPSLIHHFFFKKSPVTSQEYGSCYQIVQGMFAGFGWFFLGGRLIFSMVDVFPAV